MERMAKGANRLKSDRYQITESGICQEDVVAGRPILGLMHVTQWCLFCYPCIVLVEDEICQIRLAS
jgi:hypothetical protein